MPEPPPNPRDPGAEPELADLFRAALRGQPAGLAVVTAVIDRHPVGLLVSSLVSVSANPPVLAYSVSDTSRAGQHLLLAEQQAVHLLTIDDLDLARYFATKLRGRDEDWLPTGTSGPPMLDTHGGKFLGRVTQRIRAGRGTLVTLDVEDIVSATTETAPALVYLDRHFRGVPRA